MSKDRTQAKIKRRQARRETALNRDLARLGSQGEEQLNPFNECSPDKDCFIHVGLRNFLTTWTSSTEAAALKWDKAMTQ